MVPPELKDTVPLYAMSNSSNLHGASAMLYPEYIQEFAVEKECDFYILPSSIHEILLMPAEEGINPQDLTVNMSKKTKFSLTIPTTIPVKNKRLLCYDSESIR